MKTKQIPFESFISFLRANKVSHLVTVDDNEVAEVMIKADRIAFRYNRGTITIYKKDNPTVSLCTKADDIPYIEVLSTSPFTLFTFRPLSSCLESLE